MKAVDHVCLLPADVFVPPRSTFTEAMKMGSETYHHLKKVIQTKYGIDGGLTFLLRFLNLASFH